MAAANEAYSREEPPQNNQTSDGVFDDQAEFPTELEGEQLDAWLGGDFWVSSNNGIPGLDHVLDRNDFFGRAFSIPQLY